MSDDEGAGGAAPRSVGEGAVVDVDETLPPFVVSMLRRGSVLEPIRLDRQGRWWHRGNPIEHARIATLFSRSVGRTRGGTWVLEVGPFTYPIEVEDTPVRVVRILGGEGETLAGAQLELSDGGRVALAGAVLVDEGAAGLLVRGVAGGGRFDARVSTSVAMALAEWIVEDASAPSGYALSVGDRRVAIGVRAE